MSFVKLFMSLLVLHAISSISCARVTTRIIQPRETSSCESRQTPGPICESCELLATCVQHSNGWVNIPVESCDVANGFYCNTRLGTCSNSTGPCHPFGIEGNFQCTSQGIFPDPYDCQKYHMCYFLDIVLVAASVDCGNDKAFDARTGQCSMTLQSSVCTQPQYTCPYVGYVAAWPTNPNIFYVCKSTVNQNADDTVVTYPSLHRCNDGEIFQDFVCRNAGSTLVPPTNSPSVDPNDDGFSVIPNRCQHIGLMEDANNCRKYYYCSSLNGTMQHMDCPAGTYYRRDQFACVLGTC